MKNKFWDNEPEQIEYRIEKYVPKNIKPKSDREWYGTIEEKPVTEQDLFRLQKEYLNNGRHKEVWQEMLRICYLYTRSLLLKKLKGVFYEPAQVASAAAGAALDFMQQYLNNPNFCVGASFAGLIEFKVRGAVKELKEPDQQDQSLNAIVGGGEGDEGVEAVDLYKKFGMKPLNDYESISDPVKRLERQESFSYIDDIIDEIAELEEVSPYKRMIMLCYLTMLLRKPLSRHAPTNFMQHFAQDDTMTRLLEYVELELFNRLKQMSSEAMRVA